MNIHFVQNLLALEFEMFYTLPQAGFEDKVLYLEASDENAPLLYS